jgi:hypothetical protein
MIYRVIVPSTKQGDNKADNMMLPIYDEECDIYTLYVYCIGTTFHIGCVNEANIVE